LDFYSLEQNGITIDGGHGNGDHLNHLSGTFGVYIDNNQTIYVADTSSNHRIVEWKRNAMSGQIVAAEMEKDIQMSNSIGQQR
jgi:hypothetical protein